MKLAIVYPGVNSDGKIRSVVLPTTMPTAIVSPTARASPSTIAPTIPAVRPGETVRVRWRDTAVFGLPVAPGLRHLLDGGTRPLPIPPAGLIVTDKLAELLGVRVGDAIDAELLEGAHGTRALPIVGLIDEAFGLQAYAKGLLNGFKRERTRRYSLVVE